MTHRKFGQTAGEKERSLDCARDDRTEEVRRAGRMPALQKTKGKNAGQSLRYEDRERRLSRFERALWRQTGLDRAAGIAAG